MQTGTGTLNAGEAAENWRLSTQVCHTERPFARSPSCNASRGFVSDS